MKNQLAIAIGLVAGLVVGVVTEMTGAPGLAAFVRGVTPLGTVFINLVRMVVIPLVATTLFTGIAALADPGRLGRIGAATMAFFWVTTFLGIGIGMSVMHIGLWVAPVSTRLPTMEQAARELPTTLDFLLSLIPSNPFEAAANGALLPLIVFTALFAAAAGTLPEAPKRTLMNLAEAITGALITLVRWILWTAPVGVFALAAPVAARSGLGVLKDLAVFIVAVAVGLALFVALVYLPTVRLLGRVATGRFVRAAVGPQVIAASTTSSPATLPAMLQAAREDLAVSPAVAGLVLALGAALNRGGSALFQGASIIFLAALYHVSIEPAVLGGTIMATFLVSLTVAGVPSASLVTLAPALETAGVPLAGIAVLFGIDRIPDMCRSATNVTGTVAAATVVDRWFASRPTSGSDDHA